MKKVIFIIFLLSSAFYNYSQNVEFKAIASPKVLRVGDQFRLVYEINQEVSGLEIPDFADFQLLGGPSVGSSTSIQIINGRTTQSSQYSYTYYLKAVKEGTFSIPAAKTKYKGKVYESNIVTVEVLSAQQQQQQQSQGGAQQGQSQPQQQQQIPGVKPGEDVFVRLLVDKKSAYIGEQVVAWIKIYTKVSLADYDDQFKGPEYLGFYKEQIDLPRLQSLEQENVNGEIYHSGTIRKVILYPQKSGELTIEPFDLNVLVQQQVRTRSRSLFDEFFGPSVTNVQVTLKSNAVKINIKNLPSKPASFTGAVGNFSMNTSVDKTSLKTNEAITYKVVISGKGNIKLVDNPEINFPPNIEQFDPKINVNQATEISGSKTFEYVLIPRYAGSYTIPPFNFTYFDPAKNDYVTLTSDKYDINVEKGTDDTTNVIVSGVSKEDFRLLGKDILFIKNKPFNLVRENKFILGSPWFYIYYFLLLVLLVFIIIIRKETIKRKANTVLVKNKKANKVAKKRLKKAHLFMKQNKRDEFYEELMKTLWGYLSDKLSIPVAELSRESSKEELHNRNIEDSVINEIFDIADKCEYARFAPGTVSDGMDKLYKDAADLIGKLEDKLK